MSDETPPVGAKVHKLDDPGLTGIFVRADNNGCWLVEHLDGERHWKIADGWAVSDQATMMIEVPRWVAAKAAEWTPVDGLPVTTAIGDACRLAVES